MIDDLCRALVYTRNHIREHYPQADSDQIFLSGHSAGADPLSSIRGVITISGIYPLSNPIYDFKYSPGNLIFCALYSSNLLYPEGKTVIEYFPIEYINANDELPPFLVT